MLKIKQQKNNKYVINGYVAMAQSWTEAIAEYLARHDGGSVPMFGTNIKA